MLSAFFSRGLRSLAFFAALAFTLYFSLMPAREVEETFSREVQVWDWGFHALCYLVLAALWLAAFIPRGRDGTARRAGVALAFALLAGALELAQMLPIVGRSCQTDDFLHGALGAALGAFLLPRPLLLPHPTSSNHPTT